ncbi:MAG: hypothetical protein U9Q81_13385 [Pseudomonadota bacterium]|nr:hypothetical protein [Pseudomonadota bacterium]
MLQERLPEGARPAANRGLPSDGTERSIAKEAPLPPPSPILDDVIKPSAPREVPEGDTPSAPASSLSAIVRQMVLQPVVREVVREVARPGSAMADIAPTGERPTFRQEMRPETADGAMTPGPLPQLLAAPHLATPRAERMSPAPEASPATAERSPERADRPPALRPHTERAEDRPAPPRLKPRVERMPAFPEAPPQTTAVQVTIGRVEVRATSGPTPNAVKPRPQPATMSLDDYLAQRSGQGS